MAITPGQVTVREIIKHINDAFAVPEPVEHIYARGRWYEQPPARSQIVIEEGSPAWPIFKYLIDDNLYIPGITVDLEGVPSDGQCIVLKKVPLYDPLAS